MLFSRQQQWLLFLVILLLNFFAIYLQSQLIISGDIGFFIYAAEKLLQGGSYTGDFFESNPPLILYLSIIPLMMMKYLHLSLDVAAKLFTFILAFSSLFLNYHLLKYVFLKKDTHLAVIFFLTITFIFFFVPHREFGQREHLLVILGLPYFLLVSIRLAEKKIHPTIATLIGFFSGIGFCLKPFFFIIPISIELFFSFVNKKYSFSFRIETVTLLITCIFYLLMVLVLNPDYFSVMSPYIFRLYYAGYGTSITALLQHPEFLFCLMVTLFYFAIHPEIEYKTLHQVFLVALMICCFIFSIEGEATWYYHLIPAFSLAILCCMLVFSQALMNETISFQQSLLPALLFAFACFLLRYQHGWIMIVFFPLLFYGFFGILTFIILYYFHEHFLKALSFTSIILLITWLFSTLIKNDSFNTHQFSLSILILTLLFLVFSKENIREKKQALALFILGAALFLYPSFFLMLKYQAYNDQPLIHFMSLVQQKFHGKKIYCFSSRMHILFSRENIDIRSRFPHFWMLPGLVKKKWAQGEDAQLRQDQQYFIDMVTQDIQKQKPHIILVETNDYNLNLLDKRIDYLNYFSKDKHFKKEWGNYSYQSSMHFNNDKFSNIDIYERKPSKESINHAFF